MLHTIQILCYQGVNVKQGSTTLSLSPTSSHSLRRERPKQLRLRTEEVFIPILFKSLRPSYTYINNP
uniref:Uncharacterized protein n=1 Tax=Utricularia reniformis TaxID=192314 RepID=A0A1Y0B2R7_9LAMI|nr:hypothetical protein AEK19_MT1500 [Utricularia reniformis]ART31691.1 hypothetical protein AEK19_MT1500 [Utricularia reniformis]